MSTCLPPAQWPLILCGPLLRAATPHSVAVFVALRQPARIALRLYDPAGSPVSDQAPQPVPTRALGERLHVLCALCRPQVPLATGLLYRYDLEITRLRGGTLVTDTLGSLNDTASPPGDSPGFDSDGPSLLGGEYPLGYVPGELPGFTLAGNTAELNLLHASCRLPHGQGPDMLALADELVANAADPIQRPHQLVLTGDQIYADDVALALAQVIAATAPELLARDAARRQPGSALEEYLGELPDGPYSSGEAGGRAMADPALAPGARRRRFSREQAGLSADENDRPGHLLYLGEFYAMYLLAWSPALWPTGTDSLTVNQNTLADQQVDRKSLAEMAAGQTPHLAAFREALPRVRRALANIPTWMIFDDHELTDDWNLDGAWVSEVNGHAAGRQLLRHGLAAYAVFQDWGNRPTAYANEPGRQDLLSALTCPPAPTPLQPPTALPPLLTRGGSGERLLLDHLLGLGEAPDSDLRLDWHWHQAFASHLLVALDGRTRRSYPSSQAPAALIDPQHMPLQLAVPRLAHPDLPALVIAPVPVFDLPITENLKDIFGIPARYFWDRETWAGNAAALEALVEQLLPYGSVVILSGDIHYGFSNHAAVVRDGGEYARIVQLCASAARHEDWKTRRVSPLNQVFPARDYLLSPPASFLETVGDRIETALENLPTAAEEMAVRLRDEQFRLNLALRLTVAPDLPLLDWQEGPAPLATVDPPDQGMRCRVHYLRAETVQPYPDDPAMGPGPHPEQLLGAGAVGHNNLGQVRLDQPGSVRHRLYWMAPPLDGGPAILWYTEHQAPRALPPIDPEDI